jgi:hypothetical protein
MFCAAPIITASINGVVPSFSTSGVKKLGASVSAKKPIPVVNSVMGVMSAATPQPYLGVVSVVGVVGVVGVMVCFKCVLIVCVEYVLDGCVK